MMNMEMEILIMMNMKMEVLIMMNMEAFRMMILIDLQDNVDLKDEYLVVDLKDLDLVIGHQVKGQEGLKVEIKGLAFEVRKTLQAITMLLF